MKKIVEIFYDYLWNPKKKQNLMYIVEICKRDNILAKQSNILGLLLEKDKNDRNIS